MTRSRAGGEVSRPAGGIPAEPTGAPVRVTVCVPTRNRGSAIAPTLRSLAALTHDDFEVVVVDQSTDLRSRRAYEEVVGDDPRFSYVATDTIGLSVGRNIAVSRATGSIIAFTDDDCVVPADWLTDIERVFAAHPEAMMICGGVLAGEHDPRAGAIPTFTPRRSQLLTSPWLKYRSRGIGANLAFRASALHRAGRFDEVLGAGAPLKSCEDGDMAYRFLRAGMPVLDVPEPAVVHYGFRTWSQLRPLSRGALMACGADCMKHLRLGDPAILPTLLFLWFRRTIRWHNVFRLRRPIGASLFFEFGRGMLLSFRYRIDRRSRTYVPPAVARTDCQKSGPSAAGIR
ncbi:MAG TPA: glycosyltransferase family 2 protein [Candidatus Binatia bacterium]|nr:glycosyltransferase family 2 protein [Candidatus Binatia bacterium]